MTIARGTLSALAALGMVACTNIPDPTDREFVIDNAEETNGEFGGQAPTNDDDGVTDPTDPVWGDQGYDELTLENGYLKGAVGPVADLQGRATSLNGFQTDGWASVATTLADEHHVVMMIFEVMGDFNHSSLAAGTHAEFSSTSWPDGDAPWVSVVGCSNPESATDGFLFDQAADLVTVDVSMPTDGVLTYSYEAMFTVYDSGGNGIGSTIGSGTFDRILE